MSTLTNESFRWLDKIEHEKHKAVEAFDAELLKIFPIGSIVHFRYNDNQKNLSRGTVSKIYDGNIVVLREKPSRKGWRTGKRFWWRNIVSAEFLMKAIDAAKGGAK